MNYLQQSLLASSMLVAASCGSSNNNAPIVYGAEGSQNTRVYKSREAIYQRQQIEARNPYGQRRTTQRGMELVPAPRPAPVSYAQPTRLEPVQLAPVDAVYEPQPVRYETKAAYRPAPVRAKPVRTASAGYIEVQPGDTVYAIGRRYQVHPQAIIQENQLTPPYALAIGQALKLPANFSISHQASAKPAPTRRVVAQDKLYTVRPGDTLFAISRATNVPVQNIAAANGLAYPYALNVGQRVLVPQARTSEVYASRTEPAPVRLDREPAKPRDVADIARTASYTAPAAPEPRSFFKWPVKGAIISDYGAGSLGRRNEGVNIAAPAGTPVRAAADGEVVYRGSELDGYGNLLLVKHDAGFVTAYAHNDAMLVRKGQKVRQGQVIAKVGETGSATSPQLHFEIRQNLKSVDPGQLLGSQ